MTNLQELLTLETKKAFEQVFDKTCQEIELQPTRKEFLGDATVVVFPLLRIVKGNPVKVATQIGEKLKENTTFIRDFNVVKGFLNLEIEDHFFSEEFNKLYDKENYGHIPTQKDTPAIMVEYSSPNTNKPLHLGHIRNNLLGYSVAEILKASGKNVYKTQIINDRGIHICKSMIAWQKFGNGETPESSGLKGDHLVGKYYVAFDKVYKEQIKALTSEGIEEKEAKTKASIFLEAQEMLRKWEAQDPDTISLWKKMNGWVYEGFEQTYKNLGVDFDSYYYESNTYLLGKDIVQEGLEKGVFYRKEDNSVWCDLTENGLDEKLVLRSDGTAVYMTQDIGTAIQRVKDHNNVTGMIYTVGNEQDYHFKVLFLILQKLGYQWANDLFHLSYGMVNLPNGKMKSREGTVVDADDLIKEMQQTACDISQELGKLDEYNDQEKQQVYKTIGLGALKYFILKVDPKKSMVFNPEESVDFQGNTGPFIQYTYARIQAILRKATKDQMNIDKINSPKILDPKEKELIVQLLRYPDTIQLAAKQYSPAVIANYTYDLVKAYNSFFQNVSIFGADTIELKTFRVQLSKKVGEIIGCSFALLGIQVPERM